LQGDRLSYLTHTAQQMVVLVLDFRGEGFVAFSGSGFDIPIIIIVGQKKESVKKVVK
jgi:hypothetical protein